MPLCILDISPLVSERLAVYPGDVPYRREVSHRLSRGDTVELSSIASTLHLGAHADAPSHFLPDGASIDRLPLAPYCGPCQVVEVPAARGLRLRPAHLGNEIVAPRVLLKTGSAADPERFDPQYASLTAELADFLGRCGVVLVGIDTPSVDPSDDEHMEAHRALARHGIANLEGLVLAHVPAGLYTLVALPLRLEGAEASPVRAVLLGGAGLDFPA